MSKEVVRQIVTKRFQTFTGLAETLKAYPNRPDAKIPSAGLWARLAINFVTADVAGIGVDPYVRRTGVISITVYAHKNAGVRGIIELTDQLEEWFQFYSEGSFYTDAANTILDDEPDVHYEGIVYIPFSFDPCGS